MEKFRSYGERSQDRFGKVIENLSDVKDLKVDEVVQFERKFFCRYDHRDNDTLVFWYMHT